MRQRGTIWGAGDRDPAHLPSRRGQRGLAWRHLALPLLQARRAFDAWRAQASRSKLAPFVRLARSVRTYRASIDATIEWRLTNGIAESNNASIGRICTNA